MRRAAIKLAFFGVVCVLLLIPIGVAEITARYLGLGNPIVYYTNASYRYAPLPNQSAVRLRGANVTVDGTGLRGVEEWSTPADVKILFIGDSVTWGGTYIDDRETFAVGVCERLEQSTGKRFVCGNAGVNAYGTDNMAARVLYKDFNDETAVVVTLISGDATRGLTDMKAGIFHTMPPSGPLKGLWEASSFILGVALRFIDPEDHNRRDDDDLAVAKRSLENLFSQLRETYGGRKVLLVFSPYRGELNGRDSALTKLVKAELAQSGFDVLDMTAPMEEAVGNGANVYYDIVHLEVEGHKLYADRIADALKSHFASTAEANQ
jgi:hypothetical protein